VPPAVADASSFGWGERPISNSGTVKSLNWTWAAVLAAIPVLILVPIGHDQIWQVWIGRQLLHGASLYRDIVEVNPPLWFWMAAPLAAIGEIFGLQSRTVVVVFFAGSIALSLFLSPARYRPLLIIAFVLIPLLDFGQREHFTLIAVAPYVLLIAGRAQGEEVRHPVAIGLFAAFGFALKPFFVIVPLILEAMIWRDRRVRPETVTLALCALAYAIAVPLFAPEYLSSVVPMVRDAYRWIQGPSILPLVLGTFGMALVGFLASRYKGDPVSRTLGVAALAFLVAMIAQGKGWSYHSVPARGFLFLALAVELMRFRERPVSYALMAGAAGFCFFPVGVYQNPFRTEMEAHIADLPRGTSIFVLSDNPSVAWPMVEERGLSWTSRQFSLWQGVAAGKGVRAAEIAMRHSISRDLQRRPQVLILAGEATNLVPAGVLANYELRRRTERFTSYIRVPAARKTAPDRLLGAATEQWKLHQPILQHSLSVPARKAPSQ
jgi:hypothetical protein